MLSFELFFHEQKERTKGGSELIEVWQNNAGTTLWVDIDGEIDEPTKALLQDSLGLHPLALQDASRNRHPPKYEEFSNHSFIIYKGLSAASESIDCSTIQIALFVSDRFLVTRHSEESLSINRLRSELDEDPSLFDKGAGAMAVRIGRFIVNRYLKILLDLEPRLEAIEETIFGGAGDVILSELVAYKSDLTRLQRIFHYHKEVARELNSHPHHGFPPSEKHALTDVFEQQERATSLCTLYYQLATDLIEGYISVSSHRLNQIMRVLTIITAIFVPLSFLAGVYGMNFEYIPELHIQGGYFFLLGAMGFIAAALLFIFYRKRWL